MKITKFFKTIWKWWSFLVRKIVSLLGGCLLSIVYFVAIGTISLINFVFGKDLLQKKTRDADSFWLDKERIAADFERCKRQF